MPELDSAQLDRVRTAFTDRLGPDSPESAIGLVPNLAASRVANRLDLRGPAYTVDAACASSLVAVDQAVNELASGRCDLMLAGESTTVTTSPCGASSRNCAPSRPASASVPSTGAPTAS